MTALEKLKKYKNFPSTIIVNGLNRFGVELAKTLLEQKGFVIIIDRFNLENATLIDELNDSYESFAFVKISNSNEFIKDIPHIDYLIYLNHFIQTDQLEITPNDFLKSGTALNGFLEYAVANDSKFVLTSSLPVHLSSLNESAGKKYETKDYYTEIEQQRYLEKLVLGSFRKSALDARIVRVGEVYGAGIDINKDTELGRLVIDSSKSKTLKIYGDGLDEHPIIHLNDAIYGLLKALFTNKTEGEVFNLSNFEDNSTLGIAYALIDTKAKSDEVTFVEGSENSRTDSVSLDDDPTPSLTKIGWKPRIELSAGLNELVNSIRVDIPQGNQKKNKKNGLLKKIFAPLTRSEEKPKQKGLEDLKEETVKKKRIIHDSTSEKALSRTKKRKKKLRLIEFKFTNWYFFATIIFIFLHIILFGPVLKLLIFSGVSGLYGLNAVETLRNEEFEKSRDQLYHLESSLEKAQSGLHGLEIYFNILGQQNKFKDYDKFLASIRHFSAGAADASELLEPAANYFKNFSIRAEEQTDVSSYLADIQEKHTSFDLTYVELVKARELFAEIDLNNFPGLSARAEDINEIINEFTDKVNDYRGFIGELPEIVGYPEARTYLVLLQNNTEIRSTGGFAGSYALVKFERGQVTELTIDDIYNPDGLLDVHVEPPEPIKTLVGEDGSWSLRDSNWFAHFPLSAKQAEWFYELETERNVDGVIALNLTLMEKVLDIIGSVELEGEQVTVTASNLFDQAQEHQIDFVPGSSDKKDFLAELASEILLKVESKDPRFLISLVEIIEEELDAGEIYIYLNNSNAQRLISEQGWDGSVMITEDDFLYIVENNIGGNKVNRYTERSISKNVFLEEGKENTILEVDFSNNAQSGDWPGGTYGSYVSLYLPSDAEVSKVEGLSDWEESFEYNYKKISGYLYVLHQEKETVMIDYTTSLIGGEDGIYEYRFDLQKQAGIYDSYLDISVHFPANWEVVETNSSLSENIGLQSTSYFGFETTDNFIETRYRLNNSLQEDNDSVEETEEVN